jgi:hypothetical protein
MVDVSGLFSLQSPTANVSLTADEMALGRRDPTGYRCAASRRAAVSRLERPNSLSRPWVAKTIEWPASIMRFPSGLSGTKRRGYCAPANRVTPQPVPVPGASVTSRFPDTARSRKPRTASNRVLGESSFIGSPTDGKLRRANVRGFSCAAKRRLLEPVTRPSLATRQYDCKRPRLCILMRAVEPARYA